MCYIYIRLLFGIACLAYHTAIKFALYQPLYPEFIVNYCFDIKRAAATFALFACTLNGKHKCVSCFSDARLRRKMSNQTVGFGSSALFLVDGILGAELAVLIPYGNKCVLPFANLNLAIHKV